MLYFFNTNIVIYAIEGQIALQQRAKNHIASLEAAGHRFLISDLTLAECLVIPFRDTDGSLMLDYERFMSGPHVTI